MAAGMAQNLRMVLDALPAGYLVAAAWLTAHDVAYETFRDYVKRGVFRRPSPNVPETDKRDWKICLFSVQHVMRCDIHVGGSTALAQQDYNHCLRQDSNVRHGFMTKPYRTGFPGCR